jgi:hypothetical protein
MRLFRVDAAEAALWQKCGGRHRFAARDFRGFAPPQNRHRFAASASQEIRQRKQSPPWFGRSAFNN